MKFLTLGTIALSLGSAAFALHCASATATATDNHPGARIQFYQDGGHPDGPPPFGGPGGPGGRRGPGGPGGEGRMFAHLNLTDDQKAQAKALHEKAWAESKPYMEQLRALHEQMRQLTESGQFNEDAVRALASRQAQAEAELTVIRVRTHMAMLNLLTPEQKAKMKEMGERHRRQGPPPGEQSNR
jgi:periplasmic protein CpxP/Spy